LSNHPTWIRTCSQCSEFVVGDNGEVSTHWQRDANGEPEEVPTRRPESVPPPCPTCPKLGPNDEKKPLPPELDLFAQDWLTDARQMFLENRAVGNFGDPDPFMRAVFAEFDQAERRMERSASEDTVALLSRVLSKR
jgi:hypothetical protein